MTKPLTPSELDAIALVESHNEGADTSKFRLPVTPRDFTSRGISLVIDNGKLTDWVLCDQGLPIEAVHWFHQRLGKKLKVTFSEE